MLMQVPNGSADSGSKNQGEAADPYSTRRLPLTPSLRSRLLQVLRERDRPLLATPKAHGRELVAASDIDSERRLLAACSQRTSVGSTSTCCCRSAATGIPAGHSI